MPKEKWSKFKHFPIALIRNASFQTLAEVKSWEIKKMTPKKTANIFLLTAALVMGIYFQWKMMEIMILLIFISIILRPVSSRIMAFPALFFLFLTPLALVLKQDLLAENFAIYAYYFLIMAVIMGIYEIRKEKA